MTSLNILLSTETINRELDFQLFLAARGVREGVRYYIGRDDALRVVARHARGGVFVGRAFDPFFPGTKLDFYELLKRNHFAFVHLDEEGAVYAGDQARWVSMLNRRLDPRILASDDYVCTWGDFQGDVYRRPDSRVRDHVRTTGHPRFDLYRPAYRAYFEEEAASLRARYGDFFLINTNLSQANHGTGPAYVFNEKMGFLPGDAERRRGVIASWAYQRSVLSKFIALANRLSAEHPKAAVVLRPHPSEDLSFYTTIFRDIPNVHVLREGSVAPWIFASRAVIHDGCTTAIEAYLGDVPVLHYKAAGDSGFERYLPSRFGRAIYEEDELVGVAGEILRGHVPPNEAHVDDLARSLFANLSAEAYPKLEAVIAEAEGGPRGVSASFDAAGYALHRRGVDLVELAKGRVRPFSPKRRRMFAYGRQKFPGFHAAGVEARAARIRRVLGRPFEVRVLGDALLSVTA